MGVDKKTTLMLIEVDLQCCRCYKKIKKVLCRIPQIQDQVYNEKENFVLIKVVCCSPEKIKKKIECQGGCSVKSVKEVDQKPKEKPKEPEKPPEKPPEKEKPPPEKPKEKPPPEKPKEKPPEKEKPRDPVEQNDPDKPEGPGKPKKAKEPEKPKEKLIVTPPPQFPPPHCPPQLAYPEFRTCCTECSEGRGRGPCYSGHGRPHASYDGYYGRPIYDSYGGGGYRSSYVSQCDFFGEENSSGCSIM